MNDKLGIQVYESLCKDSDNSPAWAEIHETARAWYCEIAEKFYKTWQSDNENSQNDWLVSQLSQNARAALFYLAEHSNSAIYYSKAISEHFHLEKVFFPKADLSLLIWYGLVCQDDNAPDDVTWYSLTPMGNQIGKYLRGKFGL